MLDCLWGGEDMKTVNIRELTHHFSSYLKVVKRGERIVVMERSSPVADLIPHNDNVTSPAWKRPLQRIRVKGEPFAVTTARLRVEER
jgi:antitoxin (DNA-binding transcriptional repressor) of toxin-antitoxin stability system